MKKIHHIKNELEQEISGLIGKNEYDEFKKFAFKGQMIQMSIAFMLGVAFNNVIKGITQNIMMPIINFALSHTGKSWRVFSWEPVEGLVIELGQFCAVFVDFFLMSIILYIIYRKLLTPLWEEKPKIKCIETKKCLHCQNIIHWQCSRCPQCTTWIET